MTAASHLIASIRRALSHPSEAAGGGAADPHRNAIDVALNTLQLRDSSSFFIDHLQRGQILLQDGLTMVASTGLARPQGRQDTPRSYQNLCVDALEGDLRALRSELSEVVNALDESRSASEKRYLEQVTDWESEYYTHFLEAAAAPAPSATKPITRAALQDYLERRHPEWRGVEVIRFLALHGGFSKSTILFETRDARNGPQSLVMRAEQGVDLLCYDGSDVTKEFHLIEFMRQQGLPIAEPLWLESDESRLGFRFIVSRKVEGRIYGGAMGSKEPVTPALLQSLMSTFVKLHRIPVDPRNALLQKSHLNEWLPSAGSLYEVTQYYVNEYLPEIMRRTRMQPSPQIIRCLKWLRRNIPRTAEAPVVVHGDFSFNNLLIEKDEVAAVLDWESSRLGDPAEDIIWTQQNLAQYLDMPTFLAQYNAATGRCVTEARLAYYRVAKCVLNAVTCLNAARLIETSPDANINLALLAYQYMGLFGAEFGRLITAAERIGVNQ